MTPSKEDYLRWNTTFDGRQPFFRTQNLFETNQTYQTSNLPDQTYQTKPNNQIYQTKPTKPSPLNQTRQALHFNQTYRVSRKKVYPFAANLVNIRYKDLAHLNHTNG